MSKTAIKLIVVLVILLSLGAVALASKVFVTPTSDEFSQTTTTIGTAEVTLLNPRLAIKDVNFCVTVENTDDTNPIVTVKIQEQARDGGLWVDLSWSQCDNLVKETGCVYCVSGNAYRKIRVRGAATDAAQASAIVTYTTNRN